MHTATALLRGDCMAIAMKCRSKPTEGHLHNSSGPKNPEVIGLKALGQAKLRTAEPCRIQMLTNAK